MITLDANNSPLTKSMSESALKAAKETFNEDAYPKPWEVITHPDQMTFLGRLKACVSLVTNFQEKQNYSQVQFHGMKVIQDRNFPKDMIEIRDAKGKSLAAIKNLSVL
jgi:hypothetical protein